MAYFEQALAALAHLPERHETLAQAVDLRLDLRNALLPLDEQARMFEHLRAAEPLAERLDDPQRLGRIVSSLCFSFSVMGEHDRAIAAGQRALALATTSGAFDVQVNAQHNLSVAYFAVGDYRQVLDVAQRMIAVLTGERLSERFGLPIFPGLLFRGYGGWCLGELGDFAEGAGIGEEALRLAEAVAQPNSMVIVLYCVGLFYRRQGVLQKAILMLERGLALSQSAGLLLQFPLTASFLSAAYALAGRTEEALPLLDQMLERLATGRRTLLQALVLTELSEACLLVGRVDEASALAARLLEFSPHRAWPPGACLPAPRRGRQASRAPRYRSGCHPLPPGPDPGRGGGHAPAAGALPSGSRDPLRHGRPGGAGPCRAVDSNRDVSGHGNDLLAT